MTSEKDENPDSHTFAYFRKLERLIEQGNNTTERVLETLLRHDTRLGRIERDISEMKSDMVLMENQMLNRMNEILDLTRKIEDIRETTP